MATTVPKILIGSVVVASCVAVATTNASVREKISGLASTVGSLAFNDWGSEWSDVDSWRTTDIWTETATVDESTMEIDETTDGEGGGTEEVVYVTPDEYRAAVRDVAAAKAVVDSMNAKAAELNTRIAERDAASTALTAARRAYEKDRTKQENSIAAKKATMERAQKTVTALEKNDAQLTKIEKPTAAQRTRLTLLQGQLVRQKVLVSRLTQEYNIAAQARQRIENSYRTAEAEYVRLDELVSEMKTLHSQSAVAAAQADLAAAQQHLNVLAQRPMLEESYCPDGSIMFDGYCPSDTDSGEQMCQELGLFDGWKIGGYIGPFQLGNTACGDRLGSCLKKTKLEGEVTIQNDPSTGSWSATWKCVNELCQYEETCTKTGIGPYDETNNN